jgi:hypothetical protein
MLKRLENFLADLTVTSPTFGLIALRAQCRLHRMFPHTRPPRIKPPARHVSYLIEINDAQRQRIAHALDAYDLTHPSNDAEHDLLFEMFDDVDHLIPHTSNSDDCINGFCY